MRMRRLSVLLVAVLALGGCFQRAPHAVSYQQYRDAPAVQAAPLPALSIAAAPEPVVYAAPADQMAAPPAAVTAAPRGFLARACSAPGCGAASYAVYPAAGFDQPYLLDAGDRLRITVFGQDGLTNSYAVDAAGNITMPLVGSIRARGLTTAQLSRVLTERLKQGYIASPRWRSRWRPIGPSSSMATSPRQANMPMSPT